MLRITTFCLILALAAVHTAPLDDKQRLRFKVSARGLPDKDKLGTIDPYVEIFYTEFGGTTETKIARSDTITDNENPDWGTVFEFDFDRSKSQKWHFKVYDHDNAREDDGGGRAWVDVADYVDKGQLTQANLHKQGYLTIKSVDPVQRSGTNAPLGSLPLPPGEVERGVLKFKLSATNLPDKDDLGNTDPYVELYYTDGLTGRKNKFGRSGTLDNTKNPSWGDTFEFNFDKSKEQRWYFKLYDHDNLREDDGAGKVWVEVNDYVAKGQTMTVNLSKRGTLSIIRADGKPAGVQYNNPNPSNVKQPPTQNYTPAPISVAVPGPTPSKPVLVTEPPAKLRFKLSARGLEDRDLIGTSDPYVKIYLTQDGSTTETDAGRTGKLDDNENPEWPETFEINVDKNRHPKLRFLILDQDDARRDDELGNVTVDAIDILNTNTPFTVSLKKGSLTIQRL